MPLKKNEFYVSFPVFINNSPSPKIMLQLRRHEQLWADGPLWGQESFGDTWPALVEVLGLAWPAAREGLQTPGEPMLLPSLHQAQDQGTSSWWISKYCTPASTSQGPSPAVMAALLIIFLPASPLSPQGQLSLSLAFWTLTLPPF